MGSKVSRWVAAAGSVAVAAAVNVTTGLLTQRWAVAWFAATVMLVVLGAADLVDGRRRSCSDGEGVSFGRGIDSGGGTCY